MGAERSVAIVWKWVEREDAFAGDVRIRNEPLLKKFTQLINGDKCVAGFQPPFVLRRHDEMPQRRTPNALPFGREEVEQPVLAKRPAEHSANLLAGIIFSGKRSAILSAFVDRIGECLIKVIARIERIIGKQTVDGAMQAIAAGS